MNDDQDAVVVEPIAEVGSIALAQALATTDIEQIGRALRNDYIVVPRFTTADGEQQIRVFGSGIPERPYRLYVFSSALTFEEFLQPDDEQRSFTLTLGASLAGFIERYREQLDLIVFDAAGPNTVTAAPADVLAALQGDANENPDVAEESASLDGRTLDLELPLDGDWGIVELEHLEHRDDQLRALLERQLAGVSLNPALRSNLERWLRETCMRAEAGGGRLLAFLLQRSERAAAALTMTLYWHELGPASSGESHLDAVTDHLREGLSEGDELLGAETKAGSLVRHVREISGPEELEAASTALLVLDYWLEFPDGRGLALVSFSTPHVDIRPHWERLTDAIVLGSRWVVGTAVT